MDPAWATALVTLILAIGSGTGWAIRRRDQRKDPLPKREAELVLAEQALGIVKAAAEFSAAESAALRARVTQNEADHLADQSRIAQLELDRDDCRNRITRLEARLAHAAAYIEALLRWAQFAPIDPIRPVPPLPAELHELVSPHLWVTKAAAGPEKGNEAPQ